MRARLTDHPADRAAAVGVYHFCCPLRAREGRGEQLREQTDPLEPAGRRPGCWPTSPIFVLFTNSGSGLTMELGRSSERSTRPRIDVKRRELHIYVLQRDGLRVPHVGYRSHRLPSNDLCACCRPLPQSLRTRLCRRIRAITGTPRRITMANSQRIRLPTSPFRVTAAAGRWRLKGCKISPMSPD